MEFNKLGLLAKVSAVATAVGIGLGAAPLSLPVYTALEKGVITAPNTSAGLLGQDL